MRAVLVGFGQAGFYWYKKLRAQGMLAAVVEPDPAKKEKLLDDETPYYPSLAEALAQVEADFLVNVTPPAIHSEVNHRAFDHKLPVLCEKPISFRYEESCQVVERSMKEGIPFMIAENYRRMPYIRKMKQLIDAGVIGELSELNVAFYRYHHVQRHYTVSLLQDIGVHHIDLIRYLSGGLEGRSIQASLFNPKGGWSEHGAILNANLWIELERGVKATYVGSIASRAKSTPWSGNWRIEGTEGAIECVEQSLLLYKKDGSNETITDFSGVDPRDCLAEFVDALQYGRTPETCGADYLENERWIHYAQQSSEARMTLELGGVR